jgi:2-amino-4-hydroxy-6-hydroxymethyldihydropteridine diphosphokinase
VKAFVGLGSNLGDSVATVRSALAELGDLRATTLLAKSSLYRTAPLAAEVQPDYINAVAEIDTALAPAALLASLLALESRYGRERPAPDAPRTLDLDLLLYGDLDIDEPGLTVPHPRMHLRAFVLQPLVEIVPDCVIPGRGLARTCLTHVSSQRVEVLG